MGLRDANLAKIDGGTFDVLIVGGGINGAVSAASLAARGASVAVIDRGDFANFTSMESSNLVWGGFKYLENYELGLVRGLCRSRNHLMRAYPANLKEIRFLATLDEHSPYKPWFAALGSTAYWLIGNAFTKPPGAAQPQAHPGSRAEGQCRGFQRRHRVLRRVHRRQRLEIRLRLHQVGAQLWRRLRELRRARVGRAHRRGLAGATARQRHGARADRQRPVIVNAGGPFVDDLNAMLGVTADHRIVYSKGIHLLVPRIAGSERVLAFFDDTERLFYVIPMGPRSVIGTTDERVDTPHTHVEDADRDFLLEQINARLNLDRPLTPADIIASAAVFDRSSSRSPTRARRSRTGRRCRASTPWRSTRCRGRQHLRRQADRLREHRQRGRRGRDGARHLAGEGPRHLVRGAAEGHPRRVLPPGAADAPGQVAAAGQLRDPVHAAVAAIWLARVRHAGGNPGRPEHGAGHHRRGRVRPGGALTTPRRPR